MKQLTLFDLDVDDFKRKNKHECSHLTRRLKGDGKLTLKWLQSHIEYCEKCSSLSGLLSASFAIVERLQDVL